MFRCGRENQCIDYILWSADSSAHGSLLGKQFVRTSNPPDLGKPGMLKSRLMDGIMEHKRDVSTIRRQELAWHTKLIKILTATWHALLPHAGASFRWARS